MKKKTVLFGLVFGFVALTGFAQGTERERGFYFDFGFGSAIGFGPKGIHYNDSLSAVKETASDMGYNAIPFYIDITAGWAVLQNLYIVGTVYGMGDVMFKDSDFLMPGFRNYGVGVRFYPISTRLQIGADIGLATTVFVGSELWNNVQTDLGFAAKISAAYDFNKNMTGHSFALGGAFLASFLEDGVITATSIFAKYVFK